MYILAKEHLHPDRGKLLSQACAANNNKLHLNSWQSWIKLKIRNRSIFMPWLHNWVNIPLVVQVSERWFSGWVARSACHGVNVSHASLLIAISLPPTMCQLVMLRFLRRFELWSFPFAHNTQIILYFLCCFPTREWSRLVKCKLIRL